MRTKHETTLLKRLGAWAITLALVVGLLPQTASAAENVEYVIYTWNEEAKALTATTNILLSGSYHTVSSDTASWGQAGETTWYVVAGNVDIQNGVTVTGDVHLILSDGCTLTVTGSDGAGGDGISIQNGSSLTIYGQSAGSGAISTAGGNGSDGSGGGYGGNGGSGINVSGDQAMLTIVSAGTVTATGGTGGTGSTGGTASGTYGSSYGGDGGYGGSGICVSGNEAKLIIGGKCMVEASGGTAGKGGRGGNVTGKYHTSFGGDGGYGGRGIGVYGEYADLIFKGECSVTSNGGTGETGGSGGVASGIFGSSHAGGAGDGGNGIGLSGDYSSLTIEENSNVTANGGTSGRGASSYGGGHGISASDSDGITVKSGALTATGASGYGDGVHMNSDEGLGAFTVNGGVVNLYGGSSGDGFYIELEDGQGSFNVNGGTVTVCGGDGSSGGKGIRIDKDEDIPGSITVTGGTLNVYAGNSTDSKGEAAIHCDGDMTVSGGTVNAYGGGGSSSGGHGIYLDYSSFALSLEGGNVNTLGGAAADGTGGDGIHTKSIPDVSGNVIVSATGGSGTEGGKAVNQTANQTGGILFIKDGGAETAVGTLAGIVNLEENLDVSADYTLTIADGQTLIIPAGATLTNYGMIIVADGATLEGTLTNLGTINYKTADSSITVDGIEEKVTIQGNGITTITPATGVQVDPAAGIVTVPAGSTLQSGVQEATLLPYGGTVSVDADGNITVTVNQPPTPDDDGSGSGGLGGDEPSHSHTLAYRYDASGHWQECTDQDCPVADKGKTETAAHIYDNDTDTSCNTCGYTRTIEDSGETGGGTSTNPPAASLTVPVSGNQNTVHVSVTVDGTTATIGSIDSGDLHTVIGDHVQTGVVTIDFSELDTEIDTVKLPADVVKQIAAAANAEGNDAESLEIVLTGGTSIEFDADALGEKSVQAGGPDVTISIKRTTGSGLTSSQQQAVGGRTAYDINVTSGGVHISDMGGQVTVHAPYALHYGERAGSIVVYYVASNGSRERCETSYDSARQQVNWKTDHLSVYMIGYEESSENPETGGDTTPTISSTGDNPYVTYTVQRGDTLWTISRRYGCTVAEIVAANRELIKNPSLIYPGWQLQIPQGEEAGTQTPESPDALLPDRKYLLYTVQRGDTLWAISRKYGCTVSEIIALNGELIKTPDLIFAGWELKIPQD